MQKKEGGALGGGFYTSVYRAAIAVATQCSIEEEVGTVKKERRRRTWAATEDDVEKNTSLESGGGTISRSPISDRGAAISASAQFLADQTVMGDSKEGLACKSGLL